MPRFDVTTFGEGGLRLSVPAGQRIETAAQFEVNIAGAEANVAGALARLGWNCGWVSGLPNTPAGRRVTNEYRGAGLDLSAVVWRDEGRVSVYYVEYAEPPRPIQVAYDRQNSCCALLTPDDIDWDYLLDTRHVHMSGITAPLSDSCGEVVALALERAHANGVTTSFDVNYRHLLWSPEEARQGLSRIFESLDILVCRRRDAEEVFGLSGTPEEIVAQLGDLTSASRIVVSLSEDGMIARDGGDFHHVPAKRVNIVDRIGAGDAMVAGVLHGALQGDFAKGLRYGQVMAALAMSQHGDLVVTTQDEIDVLLDNDAGGIAR